MTPQRWQQVRAIFDEAVEYDAAARPAFLRERCAGDSELQCEVEALLASDRDTGSLLSPVLQPLAAVMPLHDSFGPYQPVRVLGEGGMGTVYLARQEQPIRRDVALKVIKLGMDSRHVMDRFEIERQTLALMDYPNVARVLDAGTSERGRPYFVMEYVDGVPITRYCDAKQLGTRERLQLFIAVCNALHHAHKKGIIHRDVKPSNILVADVDGLAVPKVIDFGISRATAERTGETSDFTMPGQIMGTPRYMSPEQSARENRDIDITTDVYSLGVVLRELLRDAVRQRDVSWIVGKATEQDRRRRYGSASEFAADIERYLKGEPVLAGPPDTVYRIEKFVTRHKGGVGAAAAVVLALVGGIVATTWQAQVAREQRTAALNQRAEAETQRIRAEQNAVEAARQRDAAQAAKEQALAEKARANKESATAKAVNDFLRNDLLSQASARSQATPDTKPDPDLKVRTALDRAAGHIEGKFSPEVEASIRLTIGNAYGDLGQYSKAQSELERALEVRRRLLGENHLDTLQAMVALSALYGLQSQYVKAGPLTVKVLEVSRRVLGENHPRTLSATGELGVNFLMRSHFSEAEPYLIQALEGSRRVLGEQHPDTLSAMHNLAFLYHMQRKYVEAEPLYSKALEVKRRVLGEEHPETLLTMNMLGKLYLSLGEYERCEQLITAVWRLRRRVLGDEHPSTRNSMSAAGLIYVLEGKNAEAEPVYRQLMESGIRRGGKENPGALNAMYYLATVQTKQGNYQEAERLLTEVLNVWRRINGSQHQDTAEAAASLGVVLLRTDRYAAAERSFREAFQYYEKHLEGWNGYKVQSLLGESLYRQKKYEDAEPAVLSGYRGLAAKQGGIERYARPEIKLAADRVVELYQNWGKPDLASEWQAKLVAAK